MHQSVLRRFALGAGLFVVASCGSTSTDSGIAAADVATTVAATLPATTPSTTAAPEPVETEPEVTEPAPTDPPVTEVVVDDTVAAAGTAPVFTLIDAGAEPRQPLRYRYEVGAVTELSQQIEQGISMTTPDGTEDASNSIVQELRYTVSAPGQVEVDIVDIGVAGGEGGTAGLDQLAMTMTLDDRGIVSAISTNLDEILTGLPPGMDAVLASLPESAKGLSFAFPEEAVGVGAIWEMQTSTSVGGIPLDTVQRFVITGITADRVDLTTELSIAKGAGEVTIPGIPAGGLHDMQMSGGGTGTMSVELSRPFATTSTVETTTVAQFSVDGVNIGQTIKQSITTTAK